MRIQPVHIEISAWHEVEIHSFKRASAKIQAFDLLLGRGVSHAATPT
jgi:hypothetical protein